METKPWYLSKTIWGAALLLLSTVLRSSGVEIADLNEPLADGIISGIGLVLVVVGRIQARKSLTAGGSTPAALLLAGALVMFAGCSLTPAQRAGWQGRSLATAQLAGTRVADVALRGLLSAAVSATDRTQKADFASSFALALRSQQGVLITSDDIRALGEIWLPGKSHWETFSMQLAAGLAHVDTSDPHAIALYLESAARELDDARAAR